MANFNNVSSSAGKPGKNGYFEKETVRNVLGRV